MKQTIKCLVAAFAAMLVAVSAFAQITTSSLGGRVTDANGEPIVGAAVVASAALLWVLWPVMESVEEPMHIYEGSYIVEYGVVCSDMAYIERDIDEMMKRAEEMERKADRLLAWVDM